VTAPPPAALPAEAWPARTPAVYLDRAYQRPGPAHADTGL